MTAFVLALVLTPATDPAGAKLFEDRIRPVLVEHCYECHSAGAKKIRGGLVVDTRAGLLEGGDSGPALVPGKPTESLLLKALRHDELAMPPKQKLPETVVADFERWIRSGAPDPRDGHSATVKTGIDITEGRKFWAFRPPTAHPVPAVRDPNWPRTDIDRFLLAALEAKQIQPAGDASRENVIRRVTIDLTGLLPTPAEIDAFVNDSSPDALAKVVDRLLASPHFGERWGRHWLDVARYADSNGKDENLTFHDAWRYRDWVIDAVNRDVPFNEFVRAQIAGDLLPAADQARRDELLVASGFLVVGPKVLADRDTAKRKMDVVDEQIDTVGRALLGLTLGCARCHDHKFDPVPTADYYALAGIFASTRTLDGFKLGNPIVSGWALRPMGERGEEMLAARKAHQKIVTDVTNQIKKVKADLKVAEDKASMRVPTKLLGFTVDDDQAEFTGEWKESTFSQPYVGRGYRHNDRSGQGQKSATFRAKLPKAGEYEVYLSYVAGSSRDKNVPVTVRHSGGETAVKLDQTKPPKLDGLFQKVGQYRFDAGEAAVTVGTAGTTGHVLIDAARFVPTGALGNDPEMAMGVPDDVKQKLSSTRDKLKELEAKEKKLKASAPPEPPMAMAPRDDEKPGPVKVHVRGNPHQLGAEVPRGWLSVTGDDCRPTVAANESGRRELADWLASRTNPLTARVFVNRVWHHLFGAGLVRTVDNFGVQGERPSHPELLDTLAVRFMDDGWSLKRLVRSIVLSRAYSMSSDDRSHSAAKIDPENRLLWRAHRRRVEAEVIRDAILQVSGALDRKPGGSAVESLGERAIDNDSKGGLNMDANTRRSVYLPIIRNDVPPILEVFDYADPDVSTGARDATTVATQALFLLNSPFVRDHAKRTADSLVHLPDDAARVSALYRRTLGRSPTATEVDRVVTYVNSGGDWPSVCSALFGCAEFRFLE